MHINNTGCTTAYDYLSSIPLPDSIKDVQTLKGIQLALTTIAQTITRIEKLLYQSTNKAEDRQFITQNIKREQNWINKILKTAKTKESFPLLGNQFMIHMPCSVKMTVTLEKLTLAKIKLNPEGAALFSLPDVLREFKQKLHYNIEVIYIVSVLYKSDYALFNQSNNKDSQKQTKPLSLAFFELLSLARRYCIRLTSSLLPANLKNIYFNLFLFFLQHIRRLSNTYQSAAPYCLHKEFVSITEIIFQAEEVQSRINSLCTLRSVLNNILNNPRGLFQGEYAYG